MCNYHSCQSAYPYFLLRFVLWYECVSCIWCFVFINLSFHMNYVCAGVIESFVDVTSCSKCSCDSFILSVQLTGSMSCSQEFHVTCTETAAKSRKNPAFQSLLCEFLYLLSLPVKFQIHLYLVFLHPLFLVFLVFHGTFCLILLSLY
jgi:hypothetical protein